MDGLAGKGGGIVFLPGGDYRIEGRLNVPSGVELRGIHDVPHHTMGGGSVLHVYPSDDEPTITLAVQQRPARPLASTIPEQRLPTMSSPTRSSSRDAASDIHVINVNAANPYKFIDFMTHRCDNHYIDYPSGAPADDRYRHRRRQPERHRPEHAVQPALLPCARPRETAASPSSPGAAFQERRCCGNTRRKTSTRWWSATARGEFLYQNFVYGSLYGIHFTRQYGAGRGGLHQPRARHRRLQGRRLLRARPRHHLHDQQRAGRHVVAEQDRHQALRRTSTPKPP